MDKVLVTGATGFLGGYLLPLLVQQGYSVVAMGRNKEIGLSLETPRIRFFCGDIRNPEDLMEAAQGCRFIIHGAALSTLWGRWEDFYQINVQATENLLHVCQTLHIERLIYISSPSVYCRRGDQLGITEEQTLPEKSLNYYIKSKKMAEDLIHGLDSPSFEWVIIRPRGLFGVGDSSIIPRLLKVNDHGGIPLFRGGSNLMDITYVENAAHSIVLAMTAENIDGETFHITNGEPMEFRRMLQLFLSKIGKPANFRKIPRGILYSLVSLAEGCYTLFSINKEPFLTRYSVITLAYSQTLDISKAEKRLGYKPLVSLERGMEIYADWYRQQD